MPITDPSLPGKFLDALKTASIDFVVLHREGEIGDRSLSGDVDIAVGSKPDEALLLAASDLRESGLVPAIRWPYDVAGTVAFFICTESGDNGMQMDLLYDPRGLGRYGIRTEALLERATMGERYSVPDPLDESLYLISKRWHKEEWPALRDQMSRLRALPNAGEAHLRAHDLFENRTAEAVNDLLNDTPPRAKPSAFRWRDLMRRAGRAMQPAGFWVEVIAPSEEGRRLVETLNDTFAAWVPHTVVESRPDAVHHLPGFIRAVMATRFRAGLALSHCATRRSPKPDLTIDWNPELTREDAAREVVAAMSQRVTR